MTRAVVRRMRSLRRMPERLMHARRRRDALQRLRHGPTPRTVLVVCHGNICRSPYAAACLRNALAAHGVDTIRVESAGFVGAGRCCPPAALKRAATRGIDMSAHRSTPLTPEQVRAADLIVVMDTDQRRALRDWFGRNGRGVLLLGDFDPHSIDARQIEDPVEQPSEAFERCYSRIERCVSAFAAELTT